MAILFHRHPYLIGCGSALSEEQLTCLISSLGRTPGPSAGVLEGRTGVSCVHLPDIGPAIVKPYTRGGLLRRINRRTYIKRGPFRCEAEFSLLGRLIHMGVNAPIPVAFACAFPFLGPLLYHAWLITRQIENADTLAAVSLRDPERAKGLMGEVKRQLGLLIENRIHHVDLHPGNVLADDQGRVYLVDFDKARIHAFSAERLEKAYIRRWRRAVVKHGLPTALMGID